MTNVWVAEAWTDGCDGTPILGVFEGFEAAADFAIKTIKDMEEDMYVHGECGTRVETKFFDGLAQYELWITYGNNPEILSDVVTLTRHELR